MLRQSNGDVSSTTRSHSSVMGPLSRRSKSSRYPHWHTTLSPLLAAVCEDGVAGRAPGDVEDDSTGASEGVDFAKEAVAEVGRLEEEGGLAAEPDGARCPPQFGQTKGAEAVAAVVG